MNDMDWMNVRDGTKVKMMDCGRWIKGGVGIRWRSVISSMRLNLNLTLVV